MISVFKSLGQFCSLRELQSPFVYLSSTLSAIIEICIFMISAAALEFFMVNQTSGLDRIINFFEQNFYYKISHLNLLSMGIIMGLISLWLNFLILKQIRKKIIFLGMMLQNKIRDKYLGLA